MSDDQQVQAQQQETPAQTTSQPAAAPTTSQSGMPEWAIELQRQVNDLGATVAKLPEATVNAVREATQPARQPRQRSTTTRTATKTETKTEAQAPASDSGVDTAQPGKTGSFADWWFGK